MTTRITAAPGADGTPENSLTGLVYALSLPVDAVMVEVCRRPGVPSYAPASLTDLFLPWEAVRRTVSSLSDVVLCRRGQTFPAGHGTSDHTTYSASAEAERENNNKDENSEAEADGRKRTKGETRSKGEKRTDGGKRVNNGEESDAEPALEPAETVTLREVFRRIAPHPPVKLHCRLREPGLEEAVCVLALEWSMAGRLILSGKLDLSLCGESSLVRRVAELYVSPEDQLPSFYRGYREIPGYDAQAARQLAELCARVESRAAHIRQDVVTRRFITMLAERGVGVSAWTVDETDDLRWFLSAGTADLSTRNIAPALALRG